MIAFQQVTKIFDNNKTAIENLSMDIQRGELVFLTGKSGAGKSTLINLLTLREHPTAGMIHCMGYDLSMIKSRHYYRYRRKIGVIFQDFNLIETLTIYENISMALEILSSNKKLIRKKVFSVLDEIGLISQANFYPEELSGGEKQRIAVARAIINKPEILLADEPTGNLDSENARDIFSSLFHLHTMGATVIIATHDESVVSSGRQIRLERGTLKTDERK